MKKTLGLLLSLTLLFVLAACGGKTEAPPKELKKVSVMLDWYPNAVHTFLYVAQEKGYFADEGVQVDIQFPANATDPLNLAAAGKVTLGFYYQPDVIMARANEDIPVKSVASIVNAPLNRIVFNADSPIKSPKDLVGKKLGYPGIPLNEALMKTMVKNDGGDPSKVEMVDVGFDLVPAIATNRTDAVIGAYINHEVPVLENQGVKTRHLNPTDYGVPAYNELVMVTGDDTWNQEQDAIQAFLRAAKKGLDDTKKNPDQALAILLNNQDEANFPLTEKIEQQSLTTLLPLMEGDFGTQNKDSWKEVQNWLLEAGLIKNAKKVDDMIAE